MLNSPYTVPSLTELFTPEQQTGKDDAALKLRSNKILKVFNFLQPIIYVCIVVLPWVIQSVYHYETLVALIMMFFGIWIMRKIKQGVKFSLQKQPSTKASPLERFEQVFNELNRVGYDGVVRDSRVIIRTAAALHENSGSIISVIDDSLRYYLQYLLRIAHIRTILNNENSLEDIKDEQTFFSDKTTYKRKIKEKIRKEIRRVMDDEINGHDGFTNQRRGKRSHKQNTEGIHIGPLFIGSEPGFEGIRWGKIFWMGDGRDFEGIKIYNQIVLGNKKDPQNNLFAKQTSQTFTTDDSCIDAEIIDLPEELNPLDQASQHASQEIKYLRSKCESLLIQSLQNDYSRITVEMRERLDREKRVIEELQRAGL